jgi:hypothetical protein
MKQYMFANLESLESKIDNVLQHSESTLKTFKVYEEETGEFLKLDVIPRLEVQERQAPKTMTEMKKNVMDLDSVKTMLAQQEMYISRISQCVEQNLDSSDVVPVLKRAHEMLEARANKLQAEFDRVFAEATR